MPSKKAIKRRILGVNTTRKIMKAMDMVASAKLLKARRRLVPARPLFSEAVRIVEKASGCKDARENAYVKPRIVKTVAYAVIAGDKGLCGSYNTNVLENALRHMDGRSGGAFPPVIKILAIGLKGRDYFARRGREIEKTYHGVSEAALYEDAAQIADDLLSRYISGEADEVYMAYTRFESALAYEPRVDRILPLGGGGGDIRGGRVIKGGGDIKSGGDIGGGRSDNSFDFMVYEPDVNVFLENAIRMYVGAFVYGALLESSASEQAARLISMDVATKNATEIIDGLTLDYNRMRQASITQEINEIVGGANIMRK